MRRIADWNIAMCVCAAMCFASTAFAQTLTTLDGDHLDASIQSISAAGEILLSGRDRAVDLQQVRDIRCDVQHATPPLSAHRLYLADGGVAVVDHVAMEQGIVTFNWSAGDGVKLPVDQVRGILMAPLGAASDEHPAGPEDLFARAIHDSQARQDQLLVIRDDGLTAVPGALQSLDESQAMFIWNGQARPIDRHKLYGITLGSPTATTADLTGDVCVTLADGSTMWGKLTGLADGVLSLQRGGNITLSLPWAQVARVRVRSERMTFLSDLEPAQQQTQATVTFAWPMRTDASVMGRPLRIGDQTFERGLGVHARSQLMYDITGKYRQFAAVIGLDAAAGTEGDCIFVVKADGKTLLTQRMKAGEPGRRIVLDVAGVKRLELTVEPGENLDVGDAADWADARLIR